MFIITNLLNYFTGKYVPPIVLVLLSIGIYYWLISEYFQTIVDNYIYLTMLLILMIVDIVSIVIIFGSKLFGNTYSTNKNVGHMDMDTNMDVIKGKHRVIKSSKKNKSVKSTDVTELKPSVNSVVGTENVVREENTNTEKIEPIDVYENNSVGSIHTYGK